MAEAQGHTPAPPVVGTAPVDVRLAYMRRMYGHLMAGIGILVAAEVLLFTTGLGHAIGAWFVEVGGLGWGLVLGAYSLVTWIATSFATGPDEHGTHRIAYGAMIAGQVLLLTPLLGVAFTLPELQGTVGRAAAVSTLGFVGLSGIALTSSKDFSFLGAILRWLAVVLVLLAVVAAVAGMHLGAVLSVAMVAFAGTAILWETQQVLRTHEPGTEFAAAMQLFSSVMLLFWYALRLFMESERS